MRQVAFAAVLTLLASLRAAMGFEIEDDLRFGPPDATPLEILSTTDFVILEPVIEEKIYHILIAENVEI